MYGAVQEVPACLGTLRRYCTRFALVCRWYSGFWVTDRHSGRVDLSLQYSLYGTSPRRQKPYHSFHSEDFPLAIESDVDTEVSDETVLGDRRCWWCGSCRVGTRYGYGVGTMNNALPTIFERFSTIVAFAETSIV